VRAATPSNLKQYWSFYWPLALTGLAMVLAIQFQNGALARYPDAATELAVFALAQGTFGFFNAALNFTPQLANVYSRDKDAHRITQRFVWLACLVLMTPLSFLAFSTPGLALIKAAYGINDALLARVADYLVLLVPVLLLNGTRLFTTGTLVQARLTGWVTTLNGIYLATIAAVLIWGFRAGVSPAYTLVGAQAIAALVHLVLSLWVRASKYRWPDEPTGQQLTFGELARFFVPVTTTGVMFALSRPVLYAFVSRTPDGIVSIAALRVAFDFSMIFQQAANQFRHFFVTFGLDDLPGKRVFMALVCAGITAIMLAVAITPLSQWVLADLLGVDERIKSRAVEVILIMCALPTIIIVRNYFHGILMVQRRTIGMAAGGILRVVGIYLVAQVLFVLGWLDHRAAAAILLLGFAIETGVVLQVAMRAGAGIDYPKPKVANAE
jgi:hypothetical protein